jgi:outer membrane protein OmpA-like peptidoglycan-associated protein
MEQAKMRQGKSAANLLLSNLRTLAVSHYLTKLGVPAKRVRTECFGQNKLKASNKTAADRACRRRVEMNVLFD